MLLTAGSRAIRIGQRRSPLNQTLAGMFNVSTRPLGPGDRQVNRHEGLSPVLDHHVQRVARRADGVDGLVQLPGLVEPGPPEPGQVLAGDVLEGVEQVVRRRVLVEPAAGVFPIRLVERLRSQHAPQGHQHGGRLVVAGDAVGAVGRIPVAVTHQLDLAALFSEVEIIPSIALLVIEALEEIGHGLRLVELGEPLVHPGVALLVRADQHGEPHVTDLVGGHLVQTQRVPLAPDAGHHRILHPAARRRTVHRGHVGIGIRQEIAGEELDRVPAVAGAFIPVAGPQLGAIERVNRGGVRPAVAVGVAHRGVGRVPQIPGRRGPGDIAHAVGPEAPGELAVGSRRGRGAGLAVGLVHDPDDAGRVARRVQPGTGLCRREPRPGS